MCVLGLLRGNCFLYLTKLETDFFFFISLLGFPEVHLKQLWSLPPGRSLSAHPARAFSCIAPCSGVTQSLLRGARPAEETGIFELSALQSVCSLLQQLQWHKEEAEQWLHRELQSGCEPVWQLQVTAMAHCWQSHPVCPSSTGNTQSWAQRAVFVILFVSSHGSENHGVVLVWGLEVNCMEPPDSPSLALAANRAG